MEILKQSSLGDLVESGRFFWATGIEDTFITHPWAATGRILDEYELTRHYGHWRQDLDLVSELGVPLIRYGIPWYRINPAPGSWDWTFPDSVFERLQELGIQPVVDLVHYGLPGWIENAYANPDFPQFMAEYAGKVAERYRGRIFCYTPLNEPRVTAWYCGKLGWWPPGLRGWRGFVTVLTSICRGIVATVRRLKMVDPETLPAHVDATDLYEATDPALIQEAQQRQEIVFLALDLIAGRVIPGHPLYEWVLKQGISPVALEWFQQNAIECSLIGINLYPLFSRKVLIKSPRGLRIRMPYATAEIIERLTQLYWERYRVPIWISETASEGSVRVRETWLRDSVSAVARVRAAGLPLVGYTWWPLFALVTWAYRQGTKPAESYLRQMGLWDLANLPGEPLRRVATPLVAEFHNLVAAGAPGMGRAQT